jgi:hypothetical protein
MLHNVDAYNEKNKMTASNLARVWAPTLAWKKESAKDPNEAMESNEHSTLLLEFLISESPLLFGDSTKINDVNLISVSSGNLETVSTQSHCLFPDPDDMCCYGAENVSGLMDTNGEQKRPHKESMSNSQFPSETSDSEINKTENLTVELDETTDRRVSVTTRKMFLTTSRDDEDIIEDISDPELDTKRKKFQRTVSLKPNKPKFVSGPKLKEDEERKYKKDLKRKRTVLTAKDFQKKSNKENDRCLEEEITPTKELALSLRGLGISSPIQILDSHLNHNISVESRFSGDTEDDRIHGKRLKKKNYNHK